MRASLGARSFAKTQNKPFLTPPNEPILRRCREPEPRALLLTRRRSVSNHARRRDVGGAGPRGHARRGPPHSDAGGASRPPGPREPACASPSPNDCLSNVGTSKDHEETIQAAPAGQRRPVACFSPPIHEKESPRRDSQRYPRVRCRSFFINRLKQYRRPSGAPTPSCDAVLSRTAGARPIKLAASRSPRHGAADRLGGADASSGHPEGLAGRWHAEHR